MKKTLLWLTALFYTMLSYGQVGINTKTPLGVFHVDGLGNTTGTTAATAANTTDDVIITSAGNVGIGTVNPVTRLHVNGTTFSSRMKIGSTAAFTSTSASIEMSDSDKGFLMNRVALTSRSVKAPVNNATVGMMVFNTTVNTAANLIEGFYYWDGTYWQLFVTDRPFNDVFSYDLDKTVATKGTSSTYTQNGTILSFGDKGLAGSRYFEIPSDGSYAFAIRLYADAWATATNVDGRACVFFTLFVDGVKKDAQEYNWPLVKQNVIGAVNKVGGSILFTAQNLKAGQKITFTAAHYNGATWSKNISLISNPGLVANKTSLVFWRL